MRRSLELILILVLHACGTLPGSLRAEEYFSPGWRPHGTSQITLKASVAKPTASGGPPPEVKSIPRGAAEAGGRSQEPLNSIHRSGTEMETMSADMPLSASPPPPLSVPPMPHAEWSAEQIIVSPAIVQAGHEYEESSRFRSGGAPKIPPQGLRAPEVSAAPPLLLPPAPDHPELTGARTINFDAGIAPPSPLPAEDSTLTPAPSIDFPPTPTPRQFVPGTVPAPGPTNRPGRQPDTYPFDRIHESDVPSGDAYEQDGFSGNGGYGRTIESMFHSGDPSDEFLGHDDQCDDFPGDGGCLDYGCDGFLHDAQGQRQCTCGRPGCRGRNRRNLGICGTVRDGRLIPWTSLGVRGSNLRTLGEVDFLYPLWQDANAVLFTNLRGQFDDRGSNDGSFGLGFRSLLKPTLVFGTYIFYDVLASQSGNEFHQGTIGAELLTLNWDFRVNGYFRESSAAFADEENGFSNGTLVTRGFVERAYAGVDAEMGRRLLFWGWNDRCQLHAFLGGYYFDHDAAGFEALAGPRTRLEFRVYDLGFLGEQSRLELGAETTYDNVRDGQFAAFLRLRIPLGAKAGRDRIDPMRRRLVDRVYHDVD